MVINELDSNIGGHKVLLYPDKTVAFINWKGILEIGKDKKSVLRKKVQITGDYLVLEDKQLRGKERVIKDKEGNVSMVLWIEDTDTKEGKIYLNGGLIGYSDAIPEKEIEKLELIRKERKLLNDLIDPMVEKGEWERVKKICGMFLDKGENRAGASLYKAISLYKLKGIRSKNIDRLISQAKRVYSSLEIKEGERRCNNFITDLTVRS